MIDIVNPGDRVRVAPSANRRTILMPWLGRTGTVLTRTHDSVRVMLDAVQALNGAARLAGIPAAQYPETFLGADLELA